MVAQTAVIFLLLTLTHFSYGDGCVRRSYGSSSFVCVCNSTYCDEAPSVGHLADGSAFKVTSTKDGARFQTSQLSFFTDQLSNSLEEAFVVNINASIQYQKINGFGGAFTDAAGINIAKLSAVTQTRLLKSYYSSEGIEYGMGRVPIGGTDFSARLYTYDDFPGDVNLSNFSLTNEDLVYKLPYIDWARNLSDKPIKLFASPWTAPAWMKSNNKLYGKGSLLPEYYQVWANYFVKFFDEYKKHNVEFWGVTTQNEPLDGLVPGFFFNCMGWTAEETAVFTGLNLGPTMAEHGYGHVQIMTMDDQRYLLPKWAKTVLSNAEAAKYVKGIAVHWYGNSYSPASLLTKTHEMFPDRFILATEACSGFEPWQTKKVILGSWERFEDYAKDILEDLNNWSTGWVDWNLALDPTGGPNWSKNFVDSPIIVNATADEFYKQPMYYALGHYSKYIPEDSVRIHLDVEQKANFERFSATAFLRPDGMRTVVIVNRSDLEKLVIINDDDHGTLEFDCPPHSIHTVVY